MLRTSIKQNSRRKPIHIGPEDDGRKMSLDDFADAIAQEGYLYELGKGVIEVSGIPQPSHAVQVQGTRDQLVSYRLAHPDIIYLIGGGSEAKMLIGPAQSERHPDISVYLSPPPAVQDVWSIWVPAIVVEVVSKSSIKRDYEVKPSEYLEFGVDEYWIIDSMKQQMTALQRWRGQWREKIVKPAQKYSTPNLPGFSLDLKRVLSTK
jgi:Uma2 family endonuclease